MTPGLRTELHRGITPYAALASAASGAAMLYGETENWAGRWAPLAECLQIISIALVPLAVGTGAWQAGRERRRRSNELIGSMARAPWQRVVVAWAAVTVGIWTGVFAVWLSAALLVAPVATYAGRNWWWMLAVAFLGLATATAVGVAIGRLASGRIVARVAGLLLFAVLAVMSVQMDPGYAWLSPSVGYHPSDGGQYLPARFHAMQAIWFCSLTATVLAATAASRKTWAVVPGGIALVTAVSIAGGPGSDRWVSDPVAREPVCALGVLEVCVARVNAFLLDELGAAVQPSLTRWTDVPGGFLRAVDSSGRHERTGLSPDRTLVLSVTQFVTPTGRISGEGVFAEYGGTLANELADAATINGRNCVPFTTDSDDDSRATELAHTWSGGDRYADFVDIERLLTLPAAEQKAWMGRYLTAARQCDEAAFTELMADLR